MKFQQIILALNRIIQVLISLEYNLFNIIPKRLVTLQFLKFLDDEERLRFSSSSLNPGIVVIVFVQHFNFYRRKVRIVLCLVILWLGIVNIVV